MLIIAMKTLASAGGVLLWVLAFVLTAFTLFIGATLCVALVSNGARGRRAARILKDLLNVIREVEK